MMRPLTWIVLAGVATLVGGEAHRRAEKGNELFRQGKNDAALEEYGKAQAAAPTAAQIPYDIGNVLYREKNYAGSAEALEKALAQAPPSLVPHVAYNLGNALFQDKRYDDAVKAYVRALKSDPKDADARRNLELTLRALERQQREKKNKPQQQQQQQQKQQPQQQQQQQQQGQQDKKDEKQGAQGQEGHQKDKDAGKEPRGDKDQPSPDKDKKEGKGRPGTMTPEEAKSLLDRVAAQERDDQRKARKKAPGTGDAQREKD